MARALISTLAILSYFMLSTSATGMHERMEREREREREREKEGYKWIAILCGAGIFKEHPIVDGKILQNSWNANNRWWWWFSRMEFENTGMLTIPGDLHVEAALPERKSTKHPWFGKIEKGQPLIYTVLKLNVWHSQ
jgi:hypothetical protein